MTPRPHPARDRLLPDELLKTAPEPVKEAQAEALEQIKRAEAARSRVQAACMAAEAAPDEDASKILDAARAGKKPPAPSEPRRIEEWEAARAAYSAVGADAERAIVRLQRTLVEHLPKFMEAQAPELANAAEAAADAAGVMAIAIANLETQAGIAVALAGADEHKTSASRGKRPIRPGKIHFDAKRWIDGEQPTRLLAQLGSAIAQLGEPISETTGQRQDREQRQRENQGPRPGHHGQVAGVAVHVPGGNQW